VWGVCVVSYYASKINKIEKSSSRILELLQNGKKLGRIEVFAEPG